MSVDKLRETHHINRVAPSDLGLLMSAQSYRPEITQAIRKIKSFPWAPLQSLVKNVISPGPHPAYGGTYPCLKTKNVNELLADLEPADFADVKGIGNLEKVQVERGDLLINLTGAGSIGRVSIYYGDDLPITNQHIARMGIKDVYDEGYVAAFLRTWWGERALEQGVAGSTGQINMVNDHVRSIPVILFNATVQKYIGDKVRQAERLRAWAKLVVDNFGVIFSTQYPPLSNYQKYQSRHFMMDVGSTFDVLTPESYPPEIGQYFRENKSFSLGELSSDIFTGNTQDDAESGEDFVFQSTSRSCTGLFLRQPFNKVVRPRNGKYLKKLDILLTCGAHDKKYIGKDVSIYHGDEVNLPSSKVLVVRLKENTLPASYVHSYLKSDAGYIQWQSVVRGITAGIHPGDVARIRIPAPTGTDKWHESSAAADESIALAGAASDFASQLTHVAKFLVEALIEGQLNEAELITAKKALQAGNDRLDRYILSRLNTDGIDGQGPTLFNDLDELYRLLALAEVD